MAFSMRLYVINPALKSDFESPHKIHVTCFDLDPFAEAQFLGFIQKLCNSYHCKTVILKQKRQDLGYERIIIVSETT